MKKIKEKKYSLLSTISKYSFVLVLAFVLVFPILVGAITDIGTPTTPTVSTGIENPLGPSGPSTLQDFLSVVINAIWIIGIPVLVLAIIYSGFLFVKAQGNPEELTKAKKTLLYTVIGGALLLGAFVIANAIVSTVDNIKSTT